LRWASSTDNGWLSEINVIDEFPVLHTYGRDYAAAELDPDWDAIDPHGQALEAARTADLVITNQSYVFALAQEQTESDVEVLLFDEAHNVESVATEALTLDFDPSALYNELNTMLKLDESGTVRGLLRALLQHPSIDQSSVLRDFRIQIFQAHDQLEKLNRLISKALQRYADDDHIDFDPDYPLVLNLEEVLSASLRDRFADIVQLLTTFEKTVEHLLAIIPKLGKLPKRLTGSLSRLIESIEENRVALHSLLDTDNNDYQVKWFEAVMLPTSEGQLSLFPITDNWRATFHSTPLDIAEWMQNTLPNLYPVRIFLSATLAVGNSFESMRNSLGMANTEVTTALFPSPFNYQKQSLLCVPTTLPIPEMSGDDAEYIEALAKHIASLAETAKGSTLALFTSRKAMRSTLPRLQERLQSHGITVLMQSEGNRSAIAARFANSQKTGEKLVLLGLRSFWEGVDFPGDILRVVVISRLPFDYSGHPVTSARQALYMSRAFGADYFREVVIPQTLLHLKQMFGRLIRNESDRGVCIVADPRLQTRSYGPFLLSNMAESIRVVGSEESVIQAVQDFLDGQIPNEKLEWNIHRAEDGALSSEQLAAIETKARRVVVHAAAGSGKTRVLVERIIYIIESSGFQALPEEVLALTYTNKAVDVMQKRLNDRIPQHYVKVMTYHKLATEIVRQQSREDGVEINMLNDDDPTKQELFDLARDYAGLDKQQLSDEEAESLVSYAQNVLVDEDELRHAIPQMDARLRAVAEFFLEFVRLLREQNLLTYSEIIVQAVNILRTNERAQQQWSRKYRWIFCDEYQDTTPAQATLIGLLGQYNHIFVVGDSAQSIYSWQGADPNNLRQFSTDYPNAAAFRLSINYRCFPRLVEGSDYFLSSTGQRYGGTIISVPERHKETQSIHVWNNQNEYDEAHSIAKLAYNFIETSRPETVTIAILARKWSILLPLEVEFIREEIPYDFSQTDSAAGFISDEGIRRLVDEAIRLLQRSEGPQLVGDTPDGQVIQGIRSGEISTATELLERTKDARFIQVADEKKYRQFLQILRGKSVQSLTRIYPSEENASRVVCSSIHSQKGEEFDLVFVTGLEDGHLPHNLKSTFSTTDLAHWRRKAQALSRASARANLTDEDMRRMYDAEEQRLFYVAMTRARYHLVLSICSERDQTQLDPSRFASSLIEAELISVTTLEETFLETPYQIKQLQSSSQSNRHKFRTNNGEWVRSKSEKILADELHRRGVYYEYEAHLDTRVKALPDFTLSDYGGVVVEHLGMLDKPDYRAHWKSKKARYKKHSIKYFTTTEIDIQNVMQSVDQLMRQIADWFVDEYSREAYAIVQIAEEVRRSSGLKVGRCIGELSSGIFEILDHPTIVAICVLDRSGGHHETVLKHSRVSWTATTDNGLPLWYAERD
jgi:superfamily I DNA/RNA helicase/Rad3-related DNA helicase